MIDVRPLIIAREGTDDAVEREVLRALADDAAQDLPFPSRLYETGGAKKLLSEKGFKALEVVMRNVYAYRGRRVQAEIPRIIVCGLAAIAVGECSRSALKGKSPAKECGAKRKGKNEGRCRAKQVRQRAGRERPVLHRFCKTKNPFSKSQMSLENKPSSSSSSEELIEVKIEMKEEETSSESNSDLVVIGEWRPGDSSYSDSMDEEVVIELSSDTSDDI